MSQRKIRNANAKNKPEEKSQKSPLQKMIWSRGLQGVPTLQLNPSNLMDWKRAIQEYLYKNHSRFGHVFEFGEHASFPMPPAPQPAEEGGAIADVDKTAYDIQVSETAKFQARYRNEFPTIYTKVWTSLSVACQEKCKEAEEYAAVNVSKDPLSLYEVILKQCTGHQGLEQLSAKARVDARKNFHRLRMFATESVQEFKVRFENELEVLKVYHVDMGDEEDLAALFIDALLLPKYSSFKEAIWNDAASGAAPYPATVHEAARRADNFRGASTSRQSEPLPVAIYPAEAKKTQDGMASRKALTNPSYAPSDDKSKGFPCPLCGRKGHAAWKCPELAVAKEAIKRAGPRVNSGGEDDQVCQDCGGDLPEDCICGPPAAAGGGGPTGKRGNKGKRKSKGYPMKVTIAVSNNEAQEMSENHVLMDIQAPIGIFANPKLLTNIRRAEQACEFSGIGTGSIVARMCGNFGDYGTVYLNLKAGVNVLGWDEVEQTTNAFFYYDNDSRELQVTIDGNTDVFTRLPCGLRGMFVDDLRLKLMKRKTANTFATVAEKRRMFSHRENVNADKAKDLMRAIGVPSAAAVKQIVNSGGVTHLDITAKDVENAITIHGADVAGAIKGKSTEPDNVAIAVERIERMLEVNVHMFVDVMFVAGYGFLVCVVKPLGLISTVLLGRKGNLKTEAKLRGALLSVIGEVKSEKFLVSSVRFDGEKGLGAMVPTIHNLGIKAVQVPGTHIPDVEVAIKLIKSWIRGIAHSRPFKVAIPLYVPLVYFVVGRLNLIPSKRGYPSVPAIEAFRGRKVNFKLDIRIGFGEYCQVVTPNLGIHKNDVTIPRSEGAISLYAKGNLSGGIVFLHLRTMKYFTRTKFTEIPMPSEVIILLNAWANDQESKHGALIEEAVEDRESDGDLIDVQTQPTLLKPQTVVEINEPEDEETFGEPSNESVVVTGVEETHPAVEAETELYTGPIEDEVSALPPKATSFADEHGEPSEVTKTVERSRSEPATRVSERIRERSRPDYATMAGAGNRKTSSVYKITVKEALRSTAMKPQALIAMTKELQQMLALNVFSPIKYEDIPVQDLKNIIRSSMFLKEKFKADGSFDKLKARLVAGGDQQDRSLYGDVYSPTATTSSVFMVAGIAAKEQRVVMTCDIGGAYLKAKMPPESKVLMRLDPLQSAIIISLDESYRSYCGKNGAIIVRLNSALYGCIESAQLWFRELSNTLKQIGFVPNALDKCVFNKEQDGSQTTVIIYVDDLMVTSRNAAAIDELKEYLIKKFGDVTFNHGTRHSYLGMDFNFAEHRVDISMPGFIADLIETGEISGVAKTPAASNLFEIDEASRQLNRELREKFHSLVAKCLYAAKRTRPDILLAVSFLTSRVTKSTDEDWTKLQRLLRYIKSTKTLGISLSSPLGAMRVRASIDAAYGVHHDGKSHSAAVISIGKGPINCRSAKQHIVVKSSYEAELVAVSDEASQVLWTREFLIFQGYNDIEAAIIEQDNQGTIQTIQRGSAGSHRSRHIKVRYYWVHDYVERNEIEIEYVPTDSLVADVLTKPLQGQRFSMLRDKLLNWQGP